MHAGLRKAWLWTKLVAIIVVVAWVVLFFVSNRNHATNVWLVFGVEFQQVSLDWIVPVTAVAALLVYFVVRKIADVVNQLSQVRQAEKARQQQQKMEDLARQVEQKLSGSEPPKAENP